MGVDFRNHQFAPGLPPGWFHIPTGALRNVTLAVDHSESGPLRAVHLSRHKWPGKINSTVIFHGLGEVQRLLFSHIPLGHLLFTFLFSRQKNVCKVAASRHPGDNPGANRWHLKSTPIQMLPPGGSICGRCYPRNFRFAPELPTSDVPLSCLQRGPDRRRSTSQIRQVLEVLNAPSTGQHLALP